MGRDRSRSRSYSPRRRSRRDASPARRDGGGGGSTSLLLRNIPHGVTPEDIRHYAEKYGPVRDVYAPKDFYTGQPRGLAFVEFGNMRDAEDAKYGLDRMVVQGREISVSFAQQGRKRPDDYRRMERQGMGYYGGRGGGGYGGGGYRNGGGGRDYGEGGSRRGRSSSRSPRRRSRSRSRSRDPSRSRRGRSRSRSHSRSRGRDAEPKRARSAERSRSRSRDRRRSRSRERSAEPKQGASVPPDSRDASPRD